MTALAAVIAAAALSGALQISNGAGHPDAFRFLGISLAALIIGLALERSFPRPPSERWEAVIVAIGGALVLEQLSQLASVPPGIYLRGVQFTDFAWRLVLFGGLMASALSTKPWLGRLHAPIALVAFSWLGAWMLKASPNPFIDVFSETNEAIRGLLHGENPWSMKYPNIYHHTLWYGPGAADNDWIYVGFPYPPMSLLISAAGWFFGDIRWANLACLLLAAGAFISMRGRFGVLAAALFLTSPRILFVLEQAWTDVYLIGLLALLLLCVQRFPKAAPFVLGVFLVTKQYMIFLVPLLPMLFPENATRREQGIFLAKAALTGLVINLPFIAMGPMVLLKALTYSQHPFRTESLSFLAMTAQNGVPTLPLWTQWALIIPVQALCWWRGPRGIAGFAFGTAATIGVFFAFSKHAFCNHHFLVVGAACAALAAIAPRGERA
ncbi:MAG: hypothetical protein DI536_12085 [Archangium gephyra]|uniref:DUF2029 domain-containing protein n=1 Tax=Archangium gephyra TaxID=48 RepID=A0A2W5TFE5_9BACT|nr:MAG: hypothetical protein DI536_12085 [Archangium gephyra]